MQHHFDQSERLNNSVLPLNAASGISEKSTFSQTGSEDAEYWISTKSKSNPKFASFHMMGRMDANPETRKRTARIQRCKFID